MDDIRPAMIGDGGGLDIPADRATLDALQAERRRDAVRRAKTAPLMAERLAGIDPDRATEPEVWSQIPILDKEQLRALSVEDFYTRFCIAPRSQVVEYWRSGGSTGRPLFYPRTALDIRHCMLGFKRVLALAGFWVQDIAHMSLPLGIHPAGHLMARSGSELGVGMVWAGGGNTAPSKAQLDMIRMFRPSAWIGMASYGLQLANLARAEGFDLAGAGIEKILCTAEPLSPSKRAKLAALWGAEVRDCFGMTEMMMLGGEDAAQAGFRFWDDFCYPEVLDPETLEPVPDGREGVLVVTSLVTNHATPFLRWNTGDIVVRSKGTAAAAGPFAVFPVIRHAHRTAGFVKVRGINIGFTDFEDLMFRSPVVADFRVAVTFDGTRDALEVELELPHGVAAEAAVTAVTQDIDRVFGLKPTPRVVPAGTIAQAFEGTVKPARFTDRR